ncbi:MAG TPA: alpha/beta fold hydrolase [Thermoanaerobaculia bacterium]|nr:alpha/beta fold hydrolase [Thermoanaerobaculia bacterium]
MTPLRRTRGPLLLILLSLSVPTRAADAPGPVDAKAAVGHWEGEIELPQNAGKLQVMVDLALAGGAWTGSIDIPMQGAKGLPLEEVSVQGSKVHFQIKGTPGTPTFDGTLTLSPAQAIQGTFMQGGASLPFRLGREAVAKPVRLQEPKPPFPYTAEEVSYTNGDVKLAATLTLPPGPGPFPAVVMITGSGAQDRDESLLGHKPFLVLADHLSRHGIAVLRADDRGIGGSTGSVPDSTTADFAQDALAGVRFLQAHPKIAKDRIGLLGHSEGGVVGPLAASQSSDVAFVVMLAGTGVPGAEVLLLQSERIARAEGVPEETIQKQLAATRKVIGVLRTESDPAARDTKLRQAAREAAEAMTPDELRTAGGVDKVVEGSSRIFASPWFRYFLDYDPRPALRKVKVPVLAVNGELDLQVIPDQNLPEIEKALKEAGNRDVTIKRMPGVNHVLQPARTGSPSEYANSEITIDPKVLDAVSQWIAERFAAPKTAG